MKDLIDQALALLTQLQDALSQERHALEQNDTELLQASVELKSSLLKQLANNGDKRNRLLQAAGCEISEQGFAAYLTSLPNAEAPPLAQLWQHLQQALQDCKDYNTVNGKIVHRSKQYVDTLINIVGGQDKQPKLYTDTGTTTKVSNLQPIARA